LFRQIVRRGLYARNGYDAESVHDYVLEMMNDPDVFDILHKNHHHFIGLPELGITLNGQWIEPIGTAAGLDKNGDVLKPLSQIYGFQEPGTVIIPERQGN
jgi:dihydroorotate dehydrogenase